MSDDGCVEFIGEMKANSDKAYLFTDGVNEFWIPKSTIISMRKIRDSDYEILIPYWLAKKKEII